MVLFLQEKLSMKSIGQVIRTYREQKDWSLSRLARETSVPEAVLQHIEAENYHALPAAPLVRGYLQLVASALGIPEETAIALWRRDAPASAEQPLQSQSETSPFHRHTWWRLQFTSMTLLGGLGLVLILFLVWQWRQVGQPPELEIHALENFQVLENPVVVNGKTDPDSTLTINTQLVSLDPQGNFSSQLELAPGERTIVVQSTDAQGRRAEKIFFVTVQ